MAGRQEQNWDSSPGYPSPLGSGVFSQKFETCTDNLFQRTETWLYLKGSGRQGQRSCVVQRRNTEFVARAL